MFPLRCQHSLAPSNCPESDLWGDQIFCDTSPNKWWICHFWVVLVLVYHLVTCTCICFRLTEQMHIHILSPTCSFLLIELVKFVWQSFSYYCSYVQAEAVLFVWMLRPLSVASTVRSRMYSTSQDTGAVVSHVLCVCSCAHCSVCVHWIWWMPECTRQSMSTA